MPTKDPELRSKHSRTYYDKNRQAYYERNVALRKRNRQLVLDYKLQHPCPCGQSHPAVLQFHHRDGDTKEATISRMIQRQCSPEKIMAEIAKCDVLCANCHLLLHHNERAEEGSNL